MTGFLPNQYPEERRLATVLFADIRNFSTLAERMDFEEITDIIKEVWLRLDKVIINHNGYIDKHMGDGVMAVWGAPFGDERDAENAVSAALECLQELKRYCATATSPEARALELRIGVNTGPVLAGYIGLRDEYTVMGDTVNIASRLEESAKLNSILISEATFGMVRGAFRVRKGEMINVKGRKQLIQVYTVQHKLTQPSRLRYRGVGGLETRLVGREKQQLQMLRVFHKAVSDKRPMFQLVEGDAGIGKSRLLLEFTNQLEADINELTLISGRGFAQTDRVPYYVWKTIWFNRFGLTDNMPMDEARQALMRGVEQLWGAPLTDKQKLNMSQVLGPMVGISFAEEQIAPVERKFSRAQIAKVHELTRILLERVCRKSPTILVVDDLQWADARSLALLRYLLTYKGSSFPLLILGASRPEFLRERPEWGAFNPVIQLKELKFTPDIAREAYPTLEFVPQHIIQELIRRADGNPYFMEEMVKGLKILQPNDEERVDTIMLTKMRAELPDTLQSMLQARLDTLSREARQVALLGSVIGRVFWKGAVVAAARFSTTTGYLSEDRLNLLPTVEQALQELVEAELAFPRAGSIFPGEKEYIFKHSILRDVAYSLLPLKYRRHYHEAVARWLSQHIEPELQVMVAVQFERAENTPSAIKYYQRAIQYAHEHGAEEEAEWLLKRIEELMELQNQ